MNLDPKDLAVAALAQIEAHPESWDQTVWTNECGTAFCFAGHVARLDGLKFAAHSIHEVIGPATDNCPVSVSTYVSERLGLTGADDMLFDCNNTLDQLRAGVKAYLNGEDICDAILAPADGE